MPTKTSENIDRDKLAVVYARFSSHNQHEQSIEGQLAEAKKFAEAKGYNIVHEYIDRAKSGRTDNREAFQQMLKDTAKKQFGVIILWKVDRFGRNREEITLNKYKCKKNGVRVEYVAETIPDSPEGVILESVLEGFAEYYSLQLSQNIQRGQRKSAEKCQSIGGNYPLGYKIGPDKKYIIDENTVETVKMIFSKYADGATVPELVSYLNDLGLRTKLGKPFTKNSLYSILRNERYKGIYIYKDMKIPDGMPRIIEDSVFDKVQELLRSNQKAPSHKWTKADYILTDKLYCGHCGNAMVGESGTSHTGDKHCYYTCTGKRKKHICNKKSVKQDVIERAVIQQVCQLLENDGLLDFIAEQTYKYYEAQDESKEQLAELEHELKECDSAMANLVKAVELGIFNSATKARMDELEQQRAELTASIANIKVCQTYKLTKDHILFYLLGFRKMDYKDIECQKKMINTFVNSIYLYDDGGITITFNFSGDKSRVTLSDLKAAESGAGFVYRASCSTKKSRLCAYSFLL